MWEHGQSENIRNIMFDVIWSKIDKASPRCPVDSQQSNCLLLMTFKQLFELFTN